MISDGQMIMKFSCIGFDIRTWPSDCISADATAWPQLEDLYEQAKALVGGENVFQLLRPNDNQQFQALRALVEPVGNAALISLRVPTAVLTAMEKRHGEPLELSIENEEWKELGFDVCDIDGFFSILHMNVLTPERTTLFEKTELCSALLLSQAANILVPSHMPFSIVGVYRLCAHAER